MSPKFSGISNQSRFVIPTQGAVVPPFSRISENISVAWKGKTNACDASWQTHIRRVPRTRRNSLSWGKKIPRSKETSNPKLQQTTAAHFRHLRPCSRPTASHRGRSDAASLAGRRGIRALAAGLLCESTRPSNILSRNVPSAARLSWGNPAESTSGLSRTYPPSNPKRRNMSTMNTTALLVTPR